MTAEIIGYANQAIQGRIERRPILIEYNPSGTVTVSGPCGMRDYRYKSHAVKFAKRVLSHPSNAAEWA
jgi:hypothetical protein